MMQIIEELNSLRLHMIDDAWVKGIYFSEFLEFGEFPAEYESVLENLDVPSVFKNIMRSINNWLDEDSEEEKSWIGLSQYIAHEKLLAILAYYIDYGTKNVLSKEYRTNAILASRLYYKFLAVSGFKAYHIYHSQLFAHSLACLTFPKTLLDKENGHLNTKERIKEVNFIFRELQHFVIDLRAIMMSLQLNPSDLNFEDILSNLVDVTGIAIGNKLNVDKIELGNVTQVIYHMIDILLIDSNGRPDPVAIRLLFKAVLPKLVAVSVDSRSANSLAQANYVTYSGLLLSKYGKAAIPGYMVLLQHICYTEDGLERCEVRQARVTLIVGLMSLLPRKSYRETIQWLLILSTTSKMTHRHIALEILAQLLTNDNDPNEVNNTEANAAENPGPSNDQQNEVPPINNEPIPGCSTDEPVANTSTAEPVASTSAGIVTEDDSSQDSQLSIQRYVRGVPEADVTGLLLERQHYTPYSAVLVAIFSRAQDPAGTVRARALAILTQCLAMNNQTLRNAIQELNGPGPVTRLTALGSSAVNDDRAAVRRAALALMHKQLVTMDHQFDETAIGILVGLCRDAAMIVRSGAVAALGELVVLRPGPVTLDAFLAGPLHQLSDPETKVLGQIGSLVQGILIGRLAARTEGPEDPLPWMFLEAITRHNLRRHLQKVCVLLSKSSTCISHRLVDALSTHLGAGDSARDLHCLVLLTSVAKIVDYGDVTFAIQYYYKLTEADECQVEDPRILSLTVELLSMWARWAAPEVRVTLRERLVQRLATATTNDCRLAIANLAMTLDPDNLTWANELLQMAERRALMEGVSAEECVRAADLAMVAPTPPDPGLLGAALNALQPPYADLDANQAGSWAACAGRLCVRSREAAARAAPVLAALLADSAAPLAARLNALRALTDVCTRYTAIVEPLMGNICLCVARGAPSPLRRAAVRCITRLLLAGFLRLRTPLYYKYCALLADEEMDVREPAEYYVTDCLAPDVIYHHFVDCILNFTAFDVEEKLNFDSRQLIYDVMAQRLSIVQKLNLQCRLAREILLHAADVFDEGDGELSPALNDSLIDVITLLCGNRMKLPKKPIGEVDLDDMDRLQERITTNIVSQKMKRQVAEVVTPAVLRLYSRLSARGGQVATYLVKIANDLLNDYRNEIEELIEHDEDLVERVRQFQQNIGVEPSFGNVRNLVTASIRHDPETPRAPRKRRIRGQATPHNRKRALRI